MMILLFQLTMPGVGSWNGKWSGVDNFYGKVKNIGRSKEAEAKGQSLLSNSPYSYSWSDGWRASIQVIRLDAKEAARLRRVIRKRDNGFCGYDWMVDSLLHYGDIRIMPNARCSRCPKVRTGSEWGVVEEGLLKYVHGQTLCPECVATASEGEGKE